MIEIWGQVSRTSGKTKKQKAKKSPKRMRECGELTTNVCLQNIEEKIKKVGVHAKENKTTTTTKQGGKQRPNKI